MKRFQAIFVISVLMALPLALFTDAGAGAMGMCDGYCCLPHSHHAQPAPRASRQASRGESPEGMSCHHGEGADRLHCTMNSNSRGMDYSILAPLGPANLSSSTALAAPVVSRQPSAGFSQAVTSGFPAAPFEPPRA